MTDVTVLVVEDEESITALIRYTLEHAGFAVSCAASAEEARILINEKLPDVALLDWMLPGQSGLQLMRHLRQNERSRDLPIIFLTARGTDTDKETGLNQGADDYLTKPFSPRELVARINALLRRRAPQKTAETIQTEGLLLDPTQRRVIADGEDVALGPTEFKLLHFFMAHAERVYSRRQLLDLVWGDHVFVEERTVDVHIRRLRRALEETGYERFIQTVRSAGYRFSAKITE